MHLLVVLDLGPYHPFILLHSWRNNVHYSTISAVNKPLILSQTFFLLQRISWVAEKSTFLAIWSKISLSAEFRIRYLVLVKKPEST